MLDRDSRELSKHAFDPDFEEQFEGFELPDFGSGLKIDPDLDDIDLDGMDEVAKIVDTKKKAQARD